jgi:hypothetical protein
MKITGVTECIGVPEATPNFSATILKLSCLSNILGQRPSVFSGKDF